MSLFEELIEDKGQDKKIIKSFKSKDSLTSQIFDISNKEIKMRDDVRNRLMKISDAFIDSLGVEFFIHDVVLTGSLANYNWSQYSDVDLHILIDMDEIDEEKKTDNTYFVNNFVKSYYIPEDVKEKDIEGKVENGVLSITLPIDKKKTLERLISLN